MPSVLFLASTNPLGATDQNVYDVLDTAGWTITVQTFALAANSDATGKDVVLVSDQGNSSPISSLFYDQAVPLVNWERGFADDYNFGTSGDRSGSTQTETNIVNTSHYITNNLSSGNLTIASPAVRQNYVEGVGSGGVTLSQVVTGDTHAGKASMVVYESGATMANSTTAAARRVHLWFTTDGNFTTDGEDLFLRAMDWAAGLDTVALSAGNMVASSETGSPAITQNHSLSTGGITANSETGNPLLSTAITLSAPDLVAPSILGAPMLRQVHALSAGDILAQSETGSPAASQRHSLLTGDLIALPELENPALSTPSYFVTVSGGGVRRPKSVTSKISNLKITPRRK